MKQVGLAQRQRTEKAIIDALLKISEIVQKTEASRRRTDTNKHSKKTIGDGDYNDEQQQQVPVPPPMRTLDSYVSGFNQQSLQRPSNCNRASVSKPKQYVLKHPANSQEHNKRYDQERRNSSDCNDQERPYKRHHYDTSSTSLLSNDHHRKKSLKQHSIIDKSFQLNKKQQQISEKTENQPTMTTFSSHSTSYQINSAATTILDDQSSSLMMIPIASAPTISPPIVVEQQQSKNPTPVYIEHQQQQFLSPPNVSAGSKTDFDLFIDQQLQATLEKRLRSHSLPSATKDHENFQRSQQPRKARLATLTKSETGKLMNELEFTKQNCNSEYYEKQRQSAMLAAKEGNYTLSYSIYTNLLHDPQYDYKLKSEILASRATSLLLEQKCFESIDDCTQAIAFNQWNKLAYVVRGACWMIKHEYSKAVEDYSKLFHFFDQSQHVLDLLNLAYEKLTLLNDDDQSIQIEQEKEEIKDDNIIKQPMTSSINTCTNPSLTSPTVYLCYPYQAYPAWYNEQSLTNGDENQQPTYMITNASFTSHPSFLADQSPIITRQTSISSEQLIRKSHGLKPISSQSIHSNNNAIQSSMDINPVTIIEHESTSLPTINEKSQSNLIWIKNPYRSF